LQKKSEPSAVADGLSLESRMTNLGFQTLIFNRPLPQAVLTSFAKPRNPMVFVEKVLV